MITVIHSGRANGEKGIYNNNVVNDDNYDSDNHGRTAW